MESFPWVELISNLGFPIVVVIMILRGWLVPGFIYDRVIKENERLTLMTEDKVIPALMEYNRTIEKVLDQVETTPRRPKAR